MGPNSLITLLSSNICNKTTLRRLHTICIVYYTKKFCWRIHFNPFHENMFNCMSKDCIAINNKLDNFDNKKFTSFNFVFLSGKEIQLCMRDVS